MRQEIRSWDAPSDGFLEGKVASRNTGEIYSRPALSWAQGGPAQAKFPLPLWGLEIQLEPISWAETSGVSWYRSVTCWGEACGGYCRAFRKTARPDTLDWDVWETLESQHDMLRQYLSRLLLALDGVTDYAIDIRVTTATN